MPLKNKHQVLSDPLRTDTESVNDPFSSSVSKEYRSYTHIYLMVPTIRNCLRELLSLLGFRSLFHFACNMKRT